MEETVYACSFLLFGGRNLRPCISCPNVAGSLAKVLDYLAAENIFIEYMYAFAQGDTAHVVIRPSNVERCMEILNKLNCNVLTKNSL